MRILFLNQFYLPDKAATAIYLSSLAEELVRRGAEVHVISGSSSYDESAKSGVARQADLREETIAGVRAHRMWNTGFGRATALGRITDYATFYMGAAIKALWLGRFDAVVSLTTPPFLYLLALVCKWLTGTRAVLWSMDCYPEAQVALGQIRENGLLHRILAGINRFGYPRLGGAIALDADMKEILERAGARDVTIIENWENIEMFERSPIDPAQWRTELGVPESDLLVSYLGNMSRGHEFKTVLDAAAILKGRGAPVSIIFRGGGQKHADVAEEAGARGLDNIKVAGYVGKRDNVVATLHASDFGLITLMEEVKGLLAPSKLYGILASGTGVLFVGPGDCEIARVIRDGDCGGAFQIGEAEKLAGFLEGMARDRASARAMGDRAQKLFLERYEASITFGKFWSFFTG
ncbi:MAG TPA: glycosyltransferase family 4 protein [Candidatus Brocadiia bacterium]|nr:glycosyltransferase family 4 protein [Candidatus Brocadiia bacterium]